MVLWENTRFPHKSCVNAFSEVKFIKNILLLITPRIDKVVERQVEHTTAESKVEFFLVFPRTELHKLQDILGAIFLVLS